MKFVRCTFLTVLDNSNDSHMHWCPVVAIDWDVVHLHNSYGLVLLHFPLHCAHVIHVLKICRQTSRTLTLQGLKVKKKQPPWP
jgi:hypothetical protein